MSWIDDAFSELGELAAHTLLVDGKPAPLVVLEEVNGFLSDVLGPATTREEQ